MLRINPFFSLLILTGCAAPFLTVDDVIVGPRKSAMIVACLEQEPLFGVRDGVENADIRFYAGERYLGTATTDEHGAALLHCPAGMANFDPPVATATWQNRVLTAQGRLFIWSTGRTAIAVDVDHTICDTDFDDLYFEPIDDDSEPIGNSPEVLTELARDYDIIYLTARPRLLAEKTRAWISAHGFPPGPLLVSPGWRDVLRPEKYKRKTLANLRHHLPNLLVGIGDRKTDSRAYTQNGMLAIRIDDDDDKPDERQIVGLADWDEIRYFLNNTYPALGKANKVKTDDLPITKQTVGK